MVGKKDRDNYVSEDYTLKPSWEYRKHMVGIVVTPITAVFLQYKTLAQVFAYILRVYQLNLLSG